MSQNKNTVEKYMEGFNASDHEKILSCLTDDVIWNMPGFFYLEGKEQFDGEIENDAFTGRPTISITRLIEEDDIVVAEGVVQAKMKNGGLLDAMFCDVFLLQDGQIKQLTTYLMHKKLSP